MARVDEEQATRGDEPITFQQIVECPECESEFHHTFVTDALDREQIVDPPESDATCPNGHTFHVVFDGWANFGDAG